MYSLIFIEMIFDDIFLPSNFFTMGQLIPMTLHLSTLLQSLYKLLNLPNYF